MAQRKSKKAKRPEKRRPRTTKAASGAKPKPEAKLRSEAKPKPEAKLRSEAKPKPEARIKSLEKERDRLKAQLEVAGARIISLEHGRDEAVNRIDWAIDSLHNMIESEA